MILFSALFTIILYSLATYLQGLYIKIPSHKLKRNIFILSLIAIVTHAFLLIFLIQEYQNLNSFKLISLVCWLINFLVYLGSIGKKNIQNLYLFTFPIASLSLLLVVIFNANTGFIHINNIQETVHITLSTLTFSTICLSSLLAGILAVQDRMLRKHHKGFTELLPSIESMEKFLFEVTIIGFLLLTLVLASSLLLSHPFFSSKFLNKIILSFFAWTVFAILLCGRFYFGWRGQTAIFWTFLGTSVLLLIYVSSFLIN